MLDGIVYRSSLNNKEYRYFLFDNNLMDSILNYVEELF